MKKVSDWFFWINHVFLISGKFYTILGILRIEKTKTIIYGDQTLVLLRRYRVFASQMHFGVLIHISFMNVFTISKCLSETCLINLSVPGFQRGIIFAEKCLKFSGTLCWIKIFQSSQLFQRTQKPTSLLMGPEYIWMRVWGVEMRKSYLK